MRVLLIKPKQIGDSLVLTPTITAIEKAYPEAEIWVVVRRGCETILAGCPDISRILTVATVEKRDRRPGDLWKELKTIWQIYTHKFDFVFELGDGSRGRNMVRLAGSGHRYSVKPTDPWGELGAQKAGCKISTFDWQTCHRVEKDFYSVSEFLPLPEPVPPMSFERRSAQPWEVAPALTDFCVVQVGSRQGFNRWSREGWREVCAAMLERFANVVVSCGSVAHELEEAAWLQQELGPRVLLTRGKASWAEMAWLFYGAKLYVGPNTAAMHLAAACQCPAVALFGPSIEDHWYPWHTHYRIVTSRGYAPVADVVERYAQVKKRTMEEIRAGDVVAACEALLLETKCAEVTGSFRPPRNIFQLLHRTIFILPPFARFQMGAIDYNFIFIRKTLEGSSLLFGGVEKFEGARNRLAQRDRHVEIEFLARAADVGQIDVLRSLGLHGLDDDFRRRIHRIGDMARELRGGDDFIRTDVVGAGVRAAQKKAQKPDDEIGGIKIGAERRSVAAHDDGTALERVAQKIPGGEMGVERQMRPQKSEGAGGDEIDTRFRAHLFRLAFGFGVGSQRRRCRIVVLLRTGWLARAGSIDRTGTDVKYSPHAAFLREIKHALRPGDDRPRAFLFLRLNRKGDGVRGRVKNVIEALILRGKIGDMALLEMEARYLPCFRILP